MALETANSIKQLVTTNPSGGDPLASADDHIRLLKSVLKACFPEVDGEVKGTQYDLSGYVPVGGIIAWSGSTTSLPHGWGLCDGTKGTPNLSGRFIVGQGTVGTKTFTMNEGGGAVDSTTSNEGAHTHTMSGAGLHSHSSQTQPHAITIAQMPQHNHGGTVMASTFNVGGQVVDGFDGGNWFDARTGSDFTGGSQAHTHGITQDGAHTHNTFGSGDHTHSVNVLPPYYALAWIMRLHPSQLA